MSPKVPAGSAEALTEEIPFLIPNSAKTNFAEVQENNQSLPRGCYIYKRKLSNRSVAKINKENRQTLFQAFFFVGWWGQREGGRDRAELGKLRCYICKYELCDHDDH